MSAMTPEAKNRLSNTVEKLRDRLLVDFRNGAESRYRLSVKIEKAGLDEAATVKRQRLDSWLDEQARSEERSKKESYQQSRERHFSTAVKLAAATFLNRIVVIRHMEAIGLVKPAVVTGGWQSPGYREFREFSSALLKDETEGYETLLRFLFDELALDLPGLFSDSGVYGLFPIPAATLRAVIEAFDDPVLESAWTDDTTLGWVYQFWNDPERNTLDEKVKNGGKIETHEITAKTQLFTDRYMVDWILQNSLNNQWLAICDKNGWVPEAISQGTIEALKNRRLNWQRLRDNNEVSLESKMPIENDSEDRWKYWVEQSVTKEDVIGAPQSIREIKILDPAVGSGHFLVIAFDLLTAFYKEEARHRGENWPDQFIAESIIERNLHGIDLDPRAVQIAAAALFLKARRLSKAASPRVINLVASNLGLASLPDDDPAIVELKREVRTATGIPETLTQKIITALKGADHLGSLLKVDETVDAAIREHEQKEMQTQAKSRQGTLFEDVKKAQQVHLPFEEARESIVNKLNGFLDKYTSGHDLGLRLRGEQLTAGVRFIRLIGKAQYHLVIANPPYHSSGKLASPEGFQKLYPQGNQDLFAAFMMRSLQLTKNHGLAATVTLSNWLYLSVYEKLRAYLLDRSQIKILADLGKAAFSSGSMLINASLNIIKNNKNEEYTSISVRPFPPEKVIVDPQQVKRNEAFLVVGKEIFNFEPQKLRKVIQGQPLIYWWDDAFLTRYAETPKLGDETEVKKGIDTGTNVRFLRFPWEVTFKGDWSKEGIINDIYKFNWVPYIKGSAGKSWIEPLSYLINWRMFGLEIRLRAQFSSGTTIRNPQLFFRKGVAFSSTGSDCTARIHEYHSICDNKGSSAYPQDKESVTCLMNSSRGRSILKSLNPTISFQVGDAKRLPLFTIPDYEIVFERIKKSFYEYETSRETSVEFSQINESNWDSTQHWAQNTIDRRLGEPLPGFKSGTDELRQTNYLSFAVGVALGRFGTNGEGVLEKVSKMALPNGILYMSTHSHQDSLFISASRLIKDVWTKYGNDIAPKKSEREWLINSFFKDVHLDMYANRPIYFPLSSKKKNFVAFISIHRWQDNTLTVLLADYLLPELNSIEGELLDLIETRTQGDRKSQADAENRYAKTKALQEELQAFIDLVQQCAEKGPPPANPKDTPRERDNTYVMDLDDGVMINSAALWPLLEPQWKQPRHWWSELCNAKGSKDYDWAHLTKRYFPTRVDAKCRIDPSLAVAHGCFWKYHPEKAYQWELRLQDEIGPDFTIDEENSDDLRKAFECENPEKVKELINAENKRRERKKQNVNEGSKKKQKNKGQPDLNFRTKE